MDGENGFNGFHLDNHFVFDDQVGSEGRPQLDAFVNDRDGVLAVELETGLFDLVGEDFFVDGFQEAGAKRFVGADGRVEDIRGDFVFCHCNLVGNAGEKYPSVFSVYELSRNESLFV
jgi:hypothetical protein